MIYHLNEGALHALQVEGKDAQHHKTKMADGGICHQFLDVLLAVGYQAP